MNSKRVRQTEPTTTRTSVNKKNSTYYNLPYYLMGLKEKSLHKSKRTPDLDTDMSSLALDKNSVHDFLTRTKYRTSDHQSKNGQSLNAENTRRCARVSKSCDFGKSVSPSGSSSMFAVKDTTSPRGVKDVTSPKDVKDTTSSRGLKDSTSSTDARNTTSSTGVRDSTSSTGVKDNTSSRNVKDITSSWGVEDTTSSRGVKKPTSSRGVKDTTSSRGIKDSTSSRGVKDSTSSRNVKDSTSTKTTIDTTSTEAVKDSMSSRGTKDSTSSKCVIDSTASRGIKDSTSSRGVKNTTSPRGIKDPTSPRGVKDKTSQRGVKDTKSPRGVKCSTSPRGVKYSTSPRGVKCYTSSTGVKDSTSPRGLKDKTSSRGVKDATSPKRVKGSTSPRGVENATSLRDVKDTTAPRGGKYNTSEKSVKDTRSSRGGKFKTSSRDGKDTTSSVTLSGWRRLSKSEFNIPPLINVSGKTPEIKAQSELLNRSSMSKPETKAHSCSLLNTSRKYSSNTKYAPPFIVDAHRHWKRSQSAFQGSGEKKVEIIKQGYRPKSKARIKSPSLERTRGQESRGKVVNVRNSPLHQKRDGVKRRTEREEKTKQKPVVSSDEFGQWDNSMKSDQDSIFDQTIGSEQYRVVFEKVTELLQSSTDETCSAAALSECLDDESKPKPKSTPSRPSRPSNDSPLRRENKNSKYTTSSANQVARSGRSNGIPPDEPEPTTTPNSVSKPSAISKRQGMSMNGASPEYNNPRTDCDSYARIFASTRLVQSRGIKEEQGEKKTTDRVGVGVGVVISPTKSCCEPNQSREADTPEQSSGVTRRKLHYRTTKRVASIRRDMKQQAKRVVHSSPTGGLRRYADDQSADSDPRTPWWDDRKLRARDNRVRHNSQAVSFSPTFGGYVEDTSRRPAPRRHADPRREDSTQSTGKSSPTREDSRRHQKTELSKQSTSSAWSAADGSRRNRHNNSDQMLLDPPLCYCNGIVGPNSTKASSGVCSQCQPPSSTKHASKRLPNSYMKRYGENGGSYSNSRSQRAGLVITIRQHEKNRRLLVSSSKQRQLSNPSVSSLCSSLNSTQSFTGGDGDGGESPRSEHGLSDNGVCEDDDELLRCRENVLQQLQRRDLVGQLLPLSPYHNKSGTDKLVSFLHHDGHTGNDSGGCKGCYCCNAMTEEEEEDHHPRYYHNNHETSASARHPRPKKDSFRKERGKDESHLYSYPRRDDGELRTQCHFPRHGVAASVLQCGYEEDEEGKQPYPRPSPPSNHEDESTTLLDFKSVLTNLYSDARLTAIRAQQVSRFIDRVVREDKAARREKAKAIREEKAIQVDKPAGGEDKVTREDKVIQVDKLGGEDKLGGKEDVIREDKVMQKDNSIREDKVIREDKMIREDTLGGEEKVVQMDNLIRKDKRNNSDKTTGLKLTTLSHKDGDVTINGGNGYRLKGTPVEILMLVGLMLVQVVLHALIS